MKIKNTYSIHPAWARNQQLPLAASKSKLVIQKNNYKKNLNDQQYAALSPLTGHVLINSGAGTGKTTVLVARMLSVAAQHPDAHILMLTFSRKAALELKSRIGAVSNCQVSTFHSLSYHIICDNGFHDFHVDDSTISRETIINKLIGQQDTTAAKVIRAMNRLTGIDDATAKVKERYFKMLLKSKTITFDSMQPFALSVLQKRPNVLHAYQKKWDFILIDEYQDSDEVQQELIKLLSANAGNVCAVGDSRQSIYGFRGAVPSIMHTFAANATAVHELNVNYRSTPPIIGLANKVMNKESPLISSSDDDSIYPQYLTADNERDEAISVTREVMKLHKAGTLYKDITVLYRSSSLMEAVVEEMISHHIPLCCKGYTNLKIFRPPYVGLLKLIRFALLPTDDTFRAIMPLLYLRRSSWKQIQYIKRQHDLPYLDAALKLPLPFFHLDYINGLKAAITNITPNTIPSAAVYHLLHAGYDKYIGPNATDVINSWHDELDSYHSLVDWMAHIDELHAQLTEMKQNAGKSNNDCVQLMTIHASKGLEFNTVFLIGAYDGALPSGRDDADLEEERRLLYVAITRAKQRLYISYPTHTGDNADSNKVSRFLAEAFQ